MVEAARRIDQDSGRLGQLPDGIESELTEVSRAVVKGVRMQVTEYRLDPSGQVHVEACRAVGVACMAFASALRRGETVRASADKHCQDTFKRLGRLEALAGRSHDPLQAAYRVATHQIVSWLHERSGALGIKREPRVYLESAVIGFIDELARLSAQGFEEALPDNHGAEAREERLLAMLLGEPVPRRVIDEAARRAGWQPPSLLRVLDVSPENALTTAMLRTNDELAHARGLVGRMADRTVVIVDAAVDIEELCRSLPSRLGVVVGPAVCLADAAASARIVFRAARDLGSGVRVVDCNERLLELMGRSASEVGHVLAVSRLQPLAKIAVEKRVKLARLLSAWLEFGTLHAEVPGVLDKSRHTLHYQMSQLEGLFGDALSGRDSRLELILALRSALPDWEIELEAVKRRRVAPGSGGTARPT